MVGYAAFPSDFMSGIHPDQVIEFLMTRDYQTVDHTGWDIIDPDWTYTDPAGHEHNHLLHRTTYQMREKYWCQDCHEHHTRDYGSALCRECSAPIEPKIKHIPPGFVTIPGLWEATLVTVVEVEEGTEFSVDMGEEEPWEFVVSGLMASDRPPSGHFRYTYAVRPK